MASLAFGSCLCLFGGDGGGGNYASVANKSSEKVRFNRSQVGCGSSLEEKSRVLRIGILCGAPSADHGISLNSAFLPDQFLITFRPLSRREHDREADVEAEDQILDDGTNHQLHCNRKSIEKASVSLDGIWIDWILEYVCSYFLSSPLLHTSFLCLQLGCLQFIDNDTGGRPWDQLLSFFACGHGLKNANEDVIQFVNK
ncbi:hypothetical protein SLE2022_106130 [Rubroshorea leprosula]